MYYVGLTGNIGSGKSEVARLFEALGATIIDADVLAREAVAPGMPAYAKIVDRWGPQVVAPDGALDRQALRRLVFGYKAQLDELNAIVHPEVTRLRDTYVAQARERGDRIVVYVVPLLFEANLRDTFDAIILVDAPTPVRLERLVRTRGLGADEAATMIAAQMPAELKRARADIVIANEGTLEELRQRVMATWEQLTAQEASSSLAR
jgi:dephospho-CoA kinase